MSKWKRLVNLIESHVSDFDDGLVPCCVVSGVKGVVTLEAALVDDLNVLVVNQKNSPDTYTFNRRLEVLVAFSSLQSPQFRTLLEEGTVDDPEEPF